MPLRTACLCVIVSEAKRANAKHFHPHLQIHNPAQIKFAMESRYKS
ncbi:MAG: hypothetical protein K2N75_00285 [Helicobacter sp.]|nr:hypothetical protein [Helicobacter sp.]MDE7174482.1 hypothetical protein [Helicobacter sp.]